MDGEQFAIYRAIHQWRYELARKEDENPSYILSNAGLMQIAKLKPTDRTTLATLIPGACKMARQFLEEIFVIVKEASIRGASEPSWMEFQIGAKLGGSGRSASRGHFTDKSQNGDRSQSVVLQVVSQLFGEVEVNGSGDAKQRKRRMAGCDLLAAPGLAKKIKSAMEWPNSTTPEQAPRSMDLVTELFGEFAPKVTKQTGRISKCRNHVASFDDDSEDRDSPRKRLVY